MSDSIFTDFNSVSAKAWKQKIQVDLKGGDYNELLLSKTNEGIVIKPFYHQDNFKKLEIPEVKIETKICQTIFVDNEEKANRIAKEVIEKGATAIRFVAQQTFDYKTLFKDLDSKIKILLICDFLDVEFVQELVEATKSYQVNIVIDILNNFVKSGNWYRSEKDDFKEIKDITNSNVGKSYIGIDASIYHNSGANSVQQIAYTLGQLNEYLNEGVILDKAEIQITFSVGSNYFFEIAKIRAFRYLFKKLIKEYQLNSTANILVEPTTRNKTIYDYNVNMLRTTTECMSAIIGGANIVSNTAYDSIYHRSNAFGSRIARNQLLVLLEESYFKNNKSIAKGSYYIEQLTYEIAEKALQLFKDIERNGGFLQQLKKGTIQRKIEESAKKEQEQFDKGEIVLLGTNKYPNKNDKMKADLELYPFVKVKARKTIIKPIIPKRLAEKLEQERLKAETNISH